jgi:hypothetical protein
VHGAPIRSHRLLVARSCPRVPVTSNRVGAVGWAKSLACRNRRTQHRWRFCPRGKQSRGHGARDFACAEYLEGRAFAHPTIRAEGAVGRRRLTELHALVVERQTQRFQKPSSQDMGVQVSPSAPLPLWRNGRRGGLKSRCLLRRAGSSPARGTNSRVWRKRKTQDA